MSTEIVKALLLLVKLCANQIDCAKCPLQDFCGKIISNW